MAPLDSISTVTRLEIIDETGRRLSYRNVYVQLDLQDNNRTLKVFVDPRAKPSPKYAPGDEPFEYPSEP